MEPDVTVEVGDWRSAKDKAPNDGHYYLEQLQDTDERYYRLTKKGEKFLSGKRVKGRGKITAITNANSELHPAVLHIEGGQDMTVEDLIDAGWEMALDGRHFPELQQSGIAAGGL